MRTDFALIRLILAGDEPVEAISVAFNWGAFAPGYEFWREALCANELTGSVRIELERILATEPEQSDDPTVEQCSACWYWRDGFCKRYPPKVIDKGRVLRAQYPLAEDGDWCGEFTAVED